MQSGGVSFESTIIAEIIRKLPNAESKSVVNATNGLEWRLGAAAFRKLFKSITADGSSEFPEFFLGQVYFAKGEMEKAKEYFIKVRKNSGWHLFRSKNPEFRKLVEGK